jgi:hypothetical protein
MLGARDGNIGPTGADGLEDDTRSKPGVSLQLSVIFPGNVSSPLHHLRHLRSCTAQPI